MRRISIAVLAFLLSMSLAAQERKCENTDTISQCTNSIVKSTLMPTTAADKAAAAAQETQDVASEATGVPTIDSFLGNSTRDFLSIFAAGLQTANLSEEQDALTLDWNLRVKELGEDPVKLQAVVRKPALLKDFTDHLAAEVDRTKLEDKLEDFDDLTLSVTYEPEDEKRGRNLAPHRTLFDSIHGQLAAVTPDATEFELASVIGQLQDIDEVRNAQEDDFTFGSISDAKREKVRERTIHAAEVIAANRASFNAAYVAQHIDRFSDLLNNQPQIYFSASRRERSSLVGPRETNVKATYEKGFVNINTFRKKAGAACPGDTCATEFTDYVTRPEIVAGLNAANRVSFSLEYSDSEDYTISDPLVPTPFDVKGSRVTNGSIVYGRMVHRDRANDRDGRFDLSITYADVRGDADKDNRFIASAVYTQKINDMMSFPIGVVWSNRDAHVPDSDRRLSAHFGLVFKMPKVMP